MKLKLNISKETVRDGGNGGSFINKEGIYDVEIVFASIDETKNGAKTINFNILHNGADQTLWGPTIVNTNGQPNDIGMSLVTKLGVIAGGEDGEDLDIETETHAVGKDKKEQEFNVVTQFSGLGCKLRVQREYSMYQGKISRRLVIRNVFRADGASAAEIVEGSEIGKQLALETEKHSSTPNYRDGITAEEAAAWEAAQRKGGSQESPTAKVVNKKSTLFS